jgi:hypothetical protein
MLELDDCVSAADRVLGRFGRLLAAYAWRVWPAGLLAVLMLGTGIAALLLGASEQQGW